VVIDLYSGIVPSLSMRCMQDRQLVSQSVLMVLWQRGDNRRVTLHLGRGCQFTSDFCEATN
jgi:transposase InsO family protein